MKMFYGIVLILMVFVSACAQQPAAQITPPDNNEQQSAADAEVQPDEAPETADDTSKGEVMEASSNEIRYVGAGGFDNDTLTISAGSAVTWFNDDEKKGAVVIFKDGRSYMNSNGLRTGEKVEVEFPEAGEYEFWWNIAFAGNSGKITVE